MKSEQFSCRATLLLQAVFKNLMMGFVIEFDTSYTLAVLSFKHVFSYVCHSLLMLLNFLFRSDSIGVAENDFFFSRLDE